MPTKTSPLKPSETGKLHLSDLYPTTRILLTLWEMDAETVNVSKGELTKRLVRKGEKSKDYLPLFEHLAAEQAISTDGKSFTLLGKGIEILGNNLDNPAFQFNSLVGMKTANALLNWIRQKQTTANTAHLAATNGHAKTVAINSFEAFQQVVLEVYDRLNRDYNLDNLVPIYRIRREIGDRVSRSNFNEWLLEMQANDILQLLEGSVEDSASDKIEDSIMTKVSGLRCYAKRLDM